MTRRPLAIVFGCAGTVLSDAERRFFRDADPLGFILFKRNCETPAQVRALVDDLRATVGRTDAPVLIDQEGGRVARLGPPHWRARFPAAAFGVLARIDAGRAEAAACLNARLIAEDLRMLGIDVDCAPVLDLPQTDADPVIGDRAFGGDPETVARLGRAFCKGLLAGGVLPVIKHVPGHGRATVDSHKALPVVEAARADLEAHDFQPFRALSDAPWAMTAHIVYRSLDAARPATASPAVIGDMIRGALGFGGVLVSDDIGMRALTGTFGARAATALAAGCDLVLHCSGAFAEMEDAAKGACALSEATAGRLAAAAVRKPRTVEALDMPAAEADLAALMAAVDGV